MKNLKELLSTNDLTTCHHYEYNEKKRIIVNYLQNSPATEILSTCMEECAEVIELLSEYLMSGRVDSVFIKEEIIDCDICTQWLASMFSIERRYTPYQYIIVDRSDTRILTCINNLSKSIQYISKCIRNKPDTLNYMQKAVQLMDESINYLTSFFNIDELMDTQWNMIYSFKIQRLEERMKVNNETQTTV